MLLLIGKRYVNTSLIVDIEQNEFHQPTMATGWFQVRYITNVPVTIMYNMYQIIAEQLSVSHAIVERAMNALTTGEQRKVMIAKVLDATREFIVTRSSGQHTDHVLNINMDLDPNLIESIKARASCLSQSTAR